MESPAEAAVLPSALYRAAQVREIDRRAIQEHGIPGYELMCRAGAAAYATLCRRWPAGPLTVLCGAGNNGGDGYVIARLAQQDGRPVRLLYLQDPHRLRGDAYTAYAAAAASGVPMAPFAAAGLVGAAVIVDALLGTGLTRPVEGIWRAAIEAINTQPAPVLAVDIPSGLCADSGAALGLAVRAAVTVTFIALKRGLFTGQGPDCSGALCYADLGVPPAWYADLEPAARRYAGEDLPVLLPPRLRGAHKGRYGHVLVVGGEHGMAGAARMCAEAAARCGAGLVSLATRPEHAAWMALARPELMAHGIPDAAALEPLLRRASVVALGPGLGRGEWGRALFERVLESTLPLVVDADGLNLLAERPRRRERWILTPHPGEAARLLNASVAEVEADRFHAATELARRYGGVTVLKGAGSLIAADAADSVPWVNQSGNPGMATGGMGDVLTGVIAALLAQGLPPTDAARAAVYLHGRAGDLAAADGERGLLASDLFPHLRRLVNPPC
ncbi:MAG TPA: NAD(P)H-hydrate dehydratase [Candidatus Competibacteraceae bacterium]|nr:NAD(P)H-hydrate dehydratase [Candidatus Competibacteraceae bacterium]